MTETKQKIGYIYKAYHSSDPTKIYIGSTERPIAIRLSRHKSLAKNKPNEKSKWYEYLRQKMYTGFLVEQLEQITFTHKMELRVKENEWMIRLRPVLNTLAAYSSEEDTKQRDKQQRQRYREVNKEIIVQQKKEWYETNKEAISQRKKLYVAANKEAIIQKRKIDYQRTKTHVCQTCNYTSDKYNFKKHIVTNRHQQRETDLLWQYYVNMFS